MLSIDDEETACKTIQKKCETDYTPPQFNTILF